MSQRIAKDGPTPTVRIGTPVIVATCATSVAMPSNAVVRPGSNAVPCGVSVRRLAWRANTGKPSRASSVRTMRLTAACVTLSSSPAAAKLPRRAAASKARRPFSEGRRRIGYPKFGLGYPQVIPFVRAPAEA